MSSWITLSWQSTGFDQSSYDLNPILRDLTARYRALPAYMAKKHMKAAMRRVLKPGIPVLRALTPPVSTRRGRRKKGEKRKSTGALRRSVTTKAGMTGGNADFDAFVWGILGYKFSGQDRKAIWLNNGTKNGVRAFQMIEHAFATIAPGATAQLAQEMAAGLEKAAAELGSGKNPGMSRRGIAAGL